MCFRYIFQKKMINFSCLYRRFSNLYWPIQSICDENEKILNIAFPDSSVLYFISSFHSKDNIILQGKIPKTLHLWNIGFYDSEGKIFHSIHDKSFPSQKFTISISEFIHESSSTHVRSPKNSMFCVVLRFYLSKETLPIIPSFLPEIIVNKKKIKTLPYETRIKYSKHVESFFTSFFAKKNYPIDVSYNIHEFFLPPKQQVDMFFPNPHAEYLVVFPSKHNVLKVEGSIPSNIGFQNDSLRYLGFMTCNLLTTSTDESLSFDELPKKYTLYVAFSQKNAERYGFNPNEDHKLLLWNLQTNKNPILVFRIVSIFKYFFSSSYPISNSVLKTMIPSFLPKVTAF